jgi:hypothetical protein
MAVAAAVTARARARETVLPASLGKSVNASVGSGRRGDDDVCQAPNSVWTKVM